MIEYMYTGSFESAESHAEDVLAIADKYAVLPLKVRLFVVCHMYEYVY